MNEIEELIKLHEGFEARPYRCSTDHLTIGFGRNLDENGITQTEGLVLLRNDIQAAKQDLMCNIPLVMAVLDAVRKAVLVDMCFNLGWQKLSKFTRMLTAIEQQDYPKAADEMVNSKWFRQVGERGERLVAMMHSGQWPKEINEKL